MNQPQVQYIPQQQIGDFIGNNLIEDDDTGFLMSPVKPVSVGNVRFANGTSPLSLFTPLKKLQVLNFLMNRWNISRAMAFVGLTRQTFTNHYTIDQSFRECVDDVREKFVDQIDEVRFETASKPSGSFDRMCVLNAYRRETYNPKIQVEIEHTVNPDQAMKRDTTVSNVIDAEVIETIRKAKQMKISSAL